MKIQTRAARIEETRAEMFRRAHGNTLRAIENRTRKKPGPKPGSTKPGTRILLLFDGADPAEAGRQVRAMFGPEASNRFRTITQQTAEPWEEKGQ